MVTTAHEKFFTVTALQIRKLRPRELKQYRFMEEGGGGGSDSWLSNSKASFSLTYSSSDPTLIQGTLLRKDSRLVQNPNWSRTAWCELYLGQVSCPIWISVSLFLKQEGIRLLTMSGIQSCEIKRADMWTSPQNSSWDYQALKESQWSSPRDWEGWDSLVAAPKTCQ